MLTIEDRLEYGPKQMALGNIHHGWGPTGEGIKGMIPQATEVFSGAASSLLKPENLISSTQTYDERGFDGYCRDLWAVLSLFGSSLLALATLERNYRPHYVQLSNSILYT